MTFSFAAQLKQWLNKKGSLQKVSIQSIYFSLHFQEYSRIEFLHQWSNEITMGKIKEIRLNIFVAFMFKVTR